ncbi:MAG TPA: glycoside hydrolase family 125 protein [Aquella sp.]|nr:glycoside hydrolase family 125 protein [Aquella sp.]
MKKTKFDWVEGRPAQRNFTSTAVEDLIKKSEAVINDKELHKLFTNTFPNTLDTTVFYYYTNDEHDTYVITGDIDAMWLRDSSAQVWPYLPLAVSDKPLQNLIAGVINRQAGYIRLDPYANAFNFAAYGSIWEDDITQMLPELHERKWEVDSLCYHIRLVYHYWQQTKDTGVFTSNWFETAKIIYQTFKQQQLLDGVYHYTFERNTTVATDTLSNHGRGNPVNPVGLIASAFRPSDDATILPFLVPSNFFARTSLLQMAEIAREVYNEQVFASDCERLAHEVEQALHEYAIVKHPKYGDIFAYEVDGFGGQILQDDANVPSLISLPYLGCLDVNNEIYQNTRSFILSKDNPWYFWGSQISGVGSIHTGSNRVWPIALVMEALTSNNKAEILQCIWQLSKTHNGTYFIHEAINKDDASDYSRPWFAWANSLFAELIIKYYNL